MMNATSQWWMPITELLLSLSSFLKVRLSGVPLILQRVSMSNRFQKNEVVYLHLESGQDFFTYEPEKWDMIVSNPPFKGKRKIFERALSFNKPFACWWRWHLWMRAAPVQLFEDRVYNFFSLIENWVHFVQPNMKQRRKITFNSSYFCCDFLLGYCDEETKQKVTGCSTLSGSSESGTRGLARPPFPVSLY